MSHQIVAAVLVIMALIATSVVAGPAKIGPSGQPESIISRVLTN